ncbi:fluoride efflux transporter CrcB [Desulfitobacterium chlororespirans]|uniref:Fluoride-specific ion channel FluC n=1 Tax=Desulfitobacterium chlororespirans DSM 11544 TaxID=1121395 RepID=A0A1M7UPQ9_9FIRM|nr:fluoride efflux transporter CrcB [Desulfitobacterium chlororespirans]SHN85001.1 camphor resistance protein CrcB [Desulfitobacterium chlororespirans DSM 11544]
MASHILLVGMGGFFGAIFRYFFSKKLNGEKLPIGTLTVNLSGAFLLGAIIGANLSTATTLLLGTGFLGAFTTFSTLKLEMAQLQLKKEHRVFILYTTITYGGGIALAYLGYWLGSFFR